MATAAALSKAGFSVVQGDYFPDNADGDREVLREIDVTGYTGCSGSGVQTIACCDLRNCIDIGSIRAALDHWPSHRNCVRFKLPRAIKEMLYYWSAPSIQKI
jgi:hypothetical protein